MLGGTAQFKHANQSIKTIGDCLCGMSAMHTLNMQQRPYRQRKYYRGSFSLNRLRANGWPISNSRTIPRTLFLVPMIHLSESRKSYGNPIIEDRLSAIYF